MLVRKVVGARAVIKLDEQPKPRVIITGGAGYVGGQVTHAFADSGWDVSVVDNLSTGRRENVPGDCTFVESEIDDCNLVNRLALEPKSAVLVHCAALTSVSESIADPQAYYANNVMATFNMLQILETRLRAVILTSSAAVYGTVGGSSNELGPCKPANPYGRTKLAGEWLVQDLTRRANIGHGVLRCFNVMGADAQLRCGPVGASGTLFSSVFDAFSGQSPLFQIDGGDHKTRDGTPERDFVHVEDVADAHVKAAEILCKGGSSFVANCGSGHTRSVLEVLQTVERITGRQVPFSFRKRREDDVSLSRADITFAREILKWEPTHDLSTMIDSGLVWFSRQVGRENSPYVGQRLP